MTTYLDSSALVALYVPERFSKSARAAVRSAGQVPFTALHHLEVPNAFELLVGRGAITGEERRAIDLELQEDLEMLRLPLPMPVMVSTNRIDFTNSRFL